MSPDAGLNSGHAGEERSMGGPVDSSPVVPAIQPSQMPLTQKPLSPPILPASSEGISEAHQIPGSPFLPHLGDEQLPTLPLPYGPIETVPPFVEPAPPHSSITAPVNSYISPPRSIAVPLYAREFLIDFGGSAIPLITPDSGLIYLTNHSLTDTPRTFGSVDMPERFTAHKECSIECSVEISDPAISYIPTPKVHRNAVGMKDPVASEKDVVDTLKPLMTATKSRIESGLCPKQEEALSPEEKVKLKKEGKRLPSDTDEAPDVASAMKFWPACTIASSVGPTLTPIALATALTSVNAKMTEFLKVSTRTLLDEALKAAAKGHLFFRVFARGGNVKTLGFAHLLAAGDSSLRGHGVSEKAKDAIRNAWDEVGGKLPIPGIKDAIDSFLDGSATLYTEVDYDAKIILGKEAEPGKKPEENRWRQRAESGTLTSMVDIHNSSGNEIHRKLTPGKFIKLTLVTAPDQNPITCDIVTNAVTQALARGAYIEGISLASTFWGCMFLVACEAEDKSFITLLASALDSTLTEPRDDDIKGMLSPMKNTQKLKAAWQKYAPLFKRTRSEILTLISSTEGENVEAAQALLIKRQLELADIVNSADQ